MGVNSREQLAIAEAIFQKRARLARDARGRHADRAGDGLVLYDTKIGRDVIIEPNVFFGPGVTVEDGAEIKANCHFERARIGRAPASARSRGCVPAPSSAPRCTSATSSR